MLKEQACIVLFFKTVPLTFLVNSPLNEESACDLWVMQINNNYHVIEHNNLSNFIFVL